MSLFGLIGEVFGAPVAVVKDLVGIKNTDPGKNTTNTGQLWQDSLDEIDDIFG